MRCPGQRSEPTSSKAALWSSHRAGFEVWAFSSAENAPLGRTTLLRSDDRIEFTTGITAITGRSRRCIRVLASSSIFFWIIVDLVAECTHRGDGAILVYPQSHGLFITLFLV